MPTPDNRNILALVAAAAVLATGLIGAFWGVLYLRRRSVMAPVISHAGFNSLQVLTMALVTRP